MTITELVTPATPNEIQRKVNELVGAVMNAGYVADFNASDSWTQETDGYSITVSASTHGQSAPRFADVWTLDDDGNYTRAVGFPSEGYTVTITTSGDVTLSVKTEGRFAGRIVIR